MKKRVLAVCAALAAVTGVAACSSSASSAPGSSTANNGASSGGTIQLAQISPTQSQVESAPEMALAAQAAVKAINAAGGVHGQKLQLTSCNDQFEASLSLRCAQQAVSSTKTIAMVGTLTGYGPQIMPLLEQAQLPMVGEVPIAPIDATSSMAFPMDAGVPGPDIAQPGVAKKYLHATKVVVIQEQQPQTAANIPYYNIGAKLSGVKIVKFIAVPADASDFTSFVAQASAAGAQAMLTTMQGPQVLGLWKALKSTNSPIKVVGTGDGIQSAVVQQAGSLVNGSYLVGGVPFANSSSATSKQFNSELAKYAPKGTAADALALRAWASVHLVAQVANGIKGPITRASFLKALKAYNGPFLWISNLSWVKPGPISTLPRITSTVVFPASLADGKIVPTDSFDPFK
jgi:ABC-type branched-subunit amino acid transport system substrate-binding protein